MNQRNDAKAARRNLKKYVWYGLKIITVVRSVIIHFAGSREIIKRTNKGGVIIITCSWCDKVKDDSDPDVKSYGVCPSCSEKLFDKDLNYDHNTKKFKKKEDDK